MALSRSQIEAFFEIGFVIVPEVFSAAEVEQMRAAFDRLQATALALGATQIYHGSQFVVETTGDRRQDVPIHEMGGQGVFVKEVQSAVLDGRADFAVHSAKDLPSAPTPGLVIAAVPERADARDAMVGSTLAGLRRGAHVGTGAVRRRAQLAATRPDLEFGELRGNIDTRLRKAGEFDAVVLAAAALIRLGRTEAITELLEPSVVMPQVGQGALAVECRADDARVRSLLAGAQHGPSRRAVDAERAYLAALGGGCDLPAGAHAVVGRGDRVRMSVVLATVDGSVVVREEGEDDDGVALGTELAGRVLART